MLILSTSKTLSDIKIMAYFHNLEGPYDVLIWFRVYLLVVIFYSNCSLFQNCSLHINDNNDDNYLSFITLLQQRTLEVYQIKNNETW